MLGPRTSWYHSQASGLMGSPTEPRMRSDARLYFFTHSGPNDCSERMAVGAVYSSDTCRMRSLSSTC